MGSRRSRQAKRRAAAAKQEAANAELSPAAVKTEPGVVEVKSEPELAQKHGDGKRKRDEVDCEMPVVKAQRVDGDDKLQGGQVAVDPLSGCGSSTAVYQDDNGVVWSFLLNYTNISFGTYGSNKFYMLQLLADRGRYMVFRKWGRVGAKNPQRALEQYNGSLEKAKQSFQKKFLDKSGNEWPLQGPFEKVDGKYVLVELNDGEQKLKEKPKEEPTEEPTEEPKREPKQQQDGIATADAVKEEEQEQKEPSQSPRDDEDVTTKEEVERAEPTTQASSSLTVGVERMPLGRLSDSQISQGYLLLQQLLSTLQEISDLNDKAEPVEQPMETASGRRSSRRRRVTPAHSSAIRHLKARLKALSSEFYTLIPHDFGRALPPPIDSLDEVKLELDMLAALSNEEIATQLQRELHRKLVSSARRQRQRRSVFDTDGSSSEDEVLPIRWDEADGSVALMGRTRAETRAARGGLPMRRAARAATSKIKSTVENDSDDEKAAAAERKKQKQKQKEEEIESKRQAEAEVEMTEYERKRLANIQRNLQFMQSMGVSTAKMEARTTIASTKR